MSEDRADVDSTDPVEARAQLQAAILRGPNFTMSQASVDAIADAIFHKQEQVNGLDSLPVVEESIRRERRAEVIAALVGEPQEKVEQQASWWADTCARHFLYWWNQCTRGVWVSEIGYAHGSGMQEALRRTNPMVYGEWVPASSFAEGTIVRYRPEAATWDGGVYEVTRRGTDEADMLVRDVLAGGYHFQYHQDDAPFGVPSWFCGMVEVKPGELAQIVVEKAHLRWEEYDRRKQREKILRIRRVQEAQEAQAVVAKGAEEQSLRASDALHEAQTLLERAGRRLRRMFSPHGKSRGW